MRICRKYRLIPQKFNENNNNMAYGGGYLWIWGVWFPQSQWNQIFKPFTKLQI